MRILQVVPYFAPAWGYGGPPRIVLDACRELARRGHAVEVVTTDALDGTSRVGKRTDTVEGIPVTYLPNVSNSLAWNQKVFWPRGARAELARAVGACDVAHLTDFRTGLHLVAHGALVRARVPYVLQPCGALPRAGGVKKLLKLAFDVAGGFALVRDAGALIATSEHERREFLALGGRGAAVRIVPHAVDAAEFDTLPARGAFRAAHGIDENALVVLFLGRINEHKGIEPLLRAFAGLAGARLVVVGRDDGFLERARGLARELGIAERVLFPGPVYGRERLGAYVDADLFAITPSHHEETSVAALEALACGTPALVTEQAPVPGMVEAGAGACVPCEVGAIRAALSELTSDVARLRTMGAAGRRHVLARFTWPVVVDQLEAAYRAAGAAT